MPNLNELKNRVAAVRGTQQVTNAMYLISASKSRRAKKKSEAVKPFFDEVKTALTEIFTDRASGFDSVFANSAPDATRVLCFAIGGDKGMAGGYNHNIIKFMADNLDKSNTAVLMAGFMGRGRAQREGFDVDPEFIYPVMNPSLDRARDIADEIMKKYRSGMYKEMCLIYTKMVSALRQEPEMLTLLPLTPEHFNAPQASAAGKYHTFHFEPGPAEVIDSLTPHYLRGVIYAALVEANTCELQSRMMAMDNATKSADDIIKSLTLRYNRARQSIITQEITEIVSGMPD